MQPRIIVPLTVGCALFMQNVDTTSLATALPAVAADLDEPVLRLHLAITSYMLSLAVFVPVSGWVADRYGARRVFRAAIVIFVLASLTCGLSTSFEMLIAARVVQGIGGAMMIPVARLILVRSVEKSELIGALALMTIPAVFGPAIGPVVGGFATTFISWRWVFWINIPIGLVCIALVTRYVTETMGTEQHKFDGLGFVLSGLGLGGIFLGFDTGSSQAASTHFAVIAFVLGIVCMALYVGHARRTAHPILDLSLLRITTFRANIVPGTPARMTIGAMPFLMPLLLQESFGYSAFHSGLITVASAIGALGMRLMTVRLVKRFGFRTVLVWSATTSSVFIAACALFEPSTPFYVIMLVLFLGGLTRTIGFMSLNALAFADVDARQMSQATGFSATAQRLSQSAGVAVAAMILHLAQGDSPTVPLDAFAITFLAMAFLTIAPAYSFARLPADVGDELTGRRPASPPKD